MLLNKRLALFNAKQKCLKNHVIEIKLSGDVLFLDLLSISLYTNRLQLEKEAYREEIGIKS